MAVPAFRQFLSVIRAKGFIPRGITNHTGSTLTVDRAAHAGHTNKLSRAAGITVTMPAATGSGTRYRFVVGTALTSNQYRFNCASGEQFRGGHLSGDSGDSSPATVDFFPAVSGNNRLDLTLAGGGGSIGDWVEFEDFATDRWLVHGVFQDVTDPTNRFSTV